MAAGVIVAVCGGPPCETWCALRGSIEGGPRILRCSASDPWGRKDPTRRESLQLDIGNALLQTMAVLLYAAARLNIGAIMEHPACWSSTPQAPSVWRLPELRFLVDGGWARLHTFDQCMTGAPFKKPTSLLAVACRAQFFLDKLGNCGRCNGLHVHEELRGYDADGRFATAKAKQYGPGFSQLLARILLDAALPRLAPAHHDGAEPGALQWFVPLDPYHSGSVWGAFGADFAA